MDSNYTELKIEHCIAYSVYILQNRKLLIFVATATEFNSLFIFFSHFILWFCCYFLFFSFLLLYTCKHFILHRPQKSHKCNKLRSIYLQYISGSWKKKKYTNSKLFTYKNSDAISFYSKSFACNSAITQSQSNNNNKKTVKNQKFCFALIFNFVCGKIWITMINEKKIHKNIIMFLTFRCLLKTCNIIIEKKKWYKKFNRKTSANSMIYDQNLSYF